MKPFESAEKIATYFIVTATTRAVASNNSPYLTLNLQNARGSIEARIWDVSDEIVKRIVKGCVVKVKGEVVQYRGQLQIKVENIEPEDINNVDAKILVAEAPVDKDKMQIAIERKINLIKDPAIYRVVFALFSEHSNLYMLYPAASKNHHDYVSGLPFHTLTMLDLAEKICEVYPDLNISLLYGGIILHDLGKVVELSDYILREYTFQGRLLGHISIANAMIKEKANAMGLGENESIVLLQHMILSHHGKLEYGSPVLPLIKEAEVLSFIDNLDARMDMMNKALDKVAEGEFTPRVFSLEQRSFYKPKKND